MTFGVEERFCPKASAVPSQKKAHDLVLVSLK